MLIIKHLSVSYQHHCSRPLNKSVVLRRPAIKKTRRVLGSGNAFAYVSAYKAVMRPKSKPKAASRSFLIRLLGVFNDYSLQAVKSRL